MYNLLIKYPTRSRPELFLKTLSEYINKAEQNESNLYLISYDEDDVTMTKEVISRAQALHENIRIYKGVGQNKIEACNRDVNRIKEWDIVLLISDDMKVIANGWDSIIREKMQEFYPDTDGCLWFHDGSIQKQISTLSCIGKKYYDRFSYIYHPSYKSFFCDNEYTEIAQGLNKIKFIEKVIASHQHPCWGGGVQTDSLYVRNDRYWSEDETNYKRRKANGYK